MMKLLLIGLWMVMACDKGDGKNPFAKPQLAEAPAAPGSVPVNAAPVGVAPPPSLAGSAVALETKPTPPPAAAWKVDDKIEGKWSDGRWYKGKISAVNADGTWNIKYDDGDVSNHFGKDRIRARGSAPAGGGSRAGGGTNNNASCPGPGITRRCNGVCVNLQEDNNNCGTCGNRCSGGKHCDGHLFCRDAEGNL